MSKQEVQSAVKGEMDLSCKELTPESKFNDEVRQTVNHPPMNVQGVPMAHQGFVDLDLGFSSPLLGCN